MSTTGVEFNEEQLLQSQLNERRRQYALDFAPPVAWGTISLVIVTFILWLVYRQYVQLLGAAIALTPCIAGMRLYPTFDRRGEHARGVYFALGLFASGVTACFILVPEVGLAALVAYIFVIIMGNLCLGPEKGPRLAGGIIILLLVGVVLTQTVTPRWFDSLDKTLGLVLTAIFVSVAVMVIALVIRGIVAEQERYFQRSKQANWEIEKRVIAERGQREQVERLMVSEREQRERLQYLLAQIRDAVNNLNSASAEIQAATTQQASGASEQSAAISQTTTTVDEVKTIAEQASVRAQEVAGAAQRTVEVSRSGHKAVQDTIGSMEQIKERVEGIAENILALSEQTQQIGEIISTVNDIASQSNILALNASIEAARAGEHGKGFAVVAVEVRNLAEQSKQATTQVKTILSEIQKATNATVMATEEGTKKVDAGVQLASQTRQVIEQLSGVINESAQAATQMVVGGRQQVSGVEQIALAMRNINQATMQSLSSTRQAEKSAQGLSELARSLAQTVAQYKL
jgi:methyl-accepting chemotaxis protein